MNIEICKKCNFHPYFIVWNFSCDKAQFIKRMIICNDKCTGEMIAEINEDIFNRILKDITDNGYKFDKSDSINMINLSNIKDKSILSSIEVNDLCPYYVENEMEFLNKKE